MPVIVNDNITLGSYVFTANPNKYSVNPAKLKTSRRSLNGKLQTTYIADESGGGPGFGSTAVVMKRSFSIGGISFEQLDDILAEFIKAENLTFIDFFNKTYTVQFDDYSIDVSSDSPEYPEYQMKLTEV